MDGLLTLEHLDRKAPLAAPLPESDADAWLLARLAAGEESALGGLMSRHGPRLRRLAARMTGAVDEAEDIVQEAFVAIWRRAARLEAEGASLGSYLTRVVVNRCIDRSRRAKLRRLIGLDLAPEFDDGQPGADRQLAARDEVRAVARDLARLPERQKAAILLQSTGEHGVGEIATILGLSIGATEQLLVRARRTLRRRALARQGEET